MKTRILLLLLGLMGYSQTFACLNEIGESKTILPGTEKNTDPANYIPEGKNYKIDSVALRHQATEFLYLWKTEKNINAYSDYGVYLVYLGKYAQAKTVFEEIEKLKPRRYATAANLGTVYELLGDNQNALTWIKRAVAIYPRAHKGSEWLHVNILEAKVKADADKNYLKNSLTSQELIKTNFGTKPMPEATLDSLKLVDLRQDIFYQLRERLSFIPPKDAVIGLLLFDLGNCSFLLKDYESAYELYKKARLYGYATNLVKQREDAIFSFRPELRPEPVALPVVQSENKSSLKSSAWWVIGGLGIFAMVGLVWWRNKNKG